MGTKTVRLRLRAKLDAIYFHLYGVTDRDDVRYIYSTFPIAGGRRWRSMAAIFRATFALRGSARSPLATRTRRSRCDGDYGALTGG